MNSRQRRTLRTIFMDPVRATIAWDDVEALLVACGATVKEGGGSMVGFTLHGVRAVFHRPHPQKETDKGAVRAVRRFLIEAGVKPDGI